MPPDEDPPIRGSALQMGPPDPPIGSIWKLKPWWCQPWSILLTGAAAIALSWQLLHSLVLSTIAAILVIAWWALFLVLVPAAWRSEQLALAEPGTGIAASSGSGPDGEMGQRISPQAR